MRRDFDFASGGFGTALFGMTIDCGGFPPVKQPAHPDRRIYPPKCERCEGKGNATNLTEAAPNGVRTLQEGRNQHSRKRGLACDVWF
jgi:hypothetical protein